MRATTLSCCCLLAIAAGLAAHERHDDGPAVVPDAERAAPAATAMAGPTANRGIRSVEPVAAIALGAEFPAMAGRDLRARVITLDPGAVVAVHEHRQRPGFAYVLEGEVVEHRQGEPAPIVRRVGERSIEGTGVVHWWENRSDRVARALVVDIVPEPVPPAQSSATAAPATGR